jgi:uncharacterized membrane protein
MNQSTILSWITFIPLIGMAAVLLVPRRNLALIKMITGGATFIPLVLATQLYFVPTTRGRAATSSSRSCPGSTTWASSTTSASTGWPCRWSG